MRKRPLVVVSPILHYAFYGKFFQDAALFKKTAYITEATAKMGLFGNGKQVAPDEHKIREQEYIGVWIVGIALRQPVREHLEHLIAGQHFREGQDAVIHEKLMPVIFDLDHFRSVLRDKILRAAQHLVLESFGIDFEQVNLEPVGRVLEIRVECDDFNILCQVVFHVGNLTDLFRERGMRRLLVAEMNGARLVAAAYPFIDGDQPVAIGFAERFERLIGLGQGLERINGGVCVFQQDLGVSALIRPDINANTRRKFRQNFFDKVLLTARGVALVIVEPARLEGKGEDAVIDFFKERRAENGDIERR